MVVYFLNSPYFSGYKKKVKKEVREKAIPEEGASAQDESNSKTENEGKQDKRYILFIGKTCVILPDVYVLSRHGEGGGLNPSPLIDIPV